MQSLGLQLSFPIPVAHMLQVITHMINRGYAASTTTTTTSAIGYIHKLLGMEDPTASFCVRKALHGAQRVASTPDQRVPISIDTLHDLVRSAETLFSSEYDVRLCQAMYLLCFHALLRIGEIAIHSLKEAEKVIQFEDVTFYRKGAQITSFSLRMTNFKHNIPNNSVHIKISANGSQFCPVNHLMRYVAVRGRGQGTRSGSAIQDTEKRPRIQIQVRELV